MPIGPARMPLFDHLGELRRRLTIIVVSVLATAVIIYFATPTLIEFMLDPLRDILGERCVFKQFEDVEINGEKRTIEETTRSFRPGRNFSLSITYNF